MRIHIPTNGAKLRFSGAVGDYTGYVIESKGALAVRADVLAP
jgi:hypothetical protein